MGYFMELPLQLAYVQQLWMEGLSRAIRDCDDTRAIEWLRAALNTDLAPDAHAVVVTMALSLEEPAWDSLAYAVSENTTRDPEIRMRALELYAQARLEPIELPALIAEAYRSGRLPAGFIDKWVPMLLARPDTRDDMAIRGIDALLAQPGRILPLKGEFASLLFIEVGTYSYRFSEAVRQRSEGALQEIRQNPNRGYALNQALIRIDAARRDSLNAAGFRVRRVPWEFAAMLTPEGCVPIWPDRLRAFAEAEVPDIRLLSRGDDCPGPYAVGDFDADGHDDVVMMAVLDAREVWALVLAGESPRLIEVTSVLGFDSTHLVQPGWFTGACAETGWMPWEGFSISYDEKGNNVFYVRDGALVEQAGDSC